MKPRYSGTASLAILCSVIFLFKATLLRGQEAEADSLTGKGLQDIQLIALQDLKNAQIWWYGWLGGYSAATAGQVVVSVTTDNLTTRQDMALGAATTLLGALGQLIAPIVPGDAKTDYPSYRDYLSGDQPLSEEQAGELLKILALREKEGRSWKTHALAGVVNISSGLVTWLGFKRTVWDGLLNFALNTAVTEAQIWTQPTRAIKNYERYLREYHLGAAMAPLRPEPEWSLTAFLGGFSIKVEF